MYFCAPSRCVCSASRSPDPALWKGPLVSLDRWQTCRIQSNLWIFLKTKSLATDSIYPQENRYLPQGWLLLQHLEGLSESGYWVGFCPWPLGSELLGCPITSQILSDVNTLCNQEKGEVSRWYLTGYRARRIRTSCYNSTLNIFFTTKDTWWLKSTKQICLFQEPNLHLLTFPVSTTFI